MRIMPRRPSLLLTFSALTVLVGAAAGQCDRREGSIGQAGIWLRQERRLSSEPFRLRRPLTASWRVRLELRGAESCDGRVLIRDSSWRLLQAIDLTAPVAWSRQTPGSEIILELEPCTDQQGVEIVTTAQIAYSTEDQFRSFSISGQTPNWVELYDHSNEPSPVPEVKRRVGDYVGVLWGFQPSTQLSWSCSGIFVGEKFFLTNWHCGGPLSMSSDEMWQETRSIFIDTSWDGDGLARELTVSEVRALSEELDYAVLEVQPVFGSAPRAPRLRAAAEVSAELRVVHHAGGETKKYSGRIAGRPGDCRPVPAPFGVAEDERFLFHNCDTEGGSSGAPVFNTAGEAVALHHCGDKDLTNGLQNRAVRIDAILADIGDPDLAAEISQPD